MGRLFKVLAVLVVVAFLGLTGYAYFGDMAPNQGKVVQPVILNVEE